MKDQDYQDKLIEERRNALWAELNREPADDFRGDFVVGALVMVVAFVLGVICGAVVACL